MYVQLELELTFVPVRLRTETPLLMQVSELPENPQFPPKQQAVLRRPYRIVQYQRVRH